MATKDRSGSVQKKHGAALVSESIRHTLNAPAPLLRRSVIKMGRVGVCVIGCQASGVLCADCAESVSNQPGVSLFYIRPNSGRPCDLCAFRRNNPSLTLQPEARPR